MGWGMVGWGVMCVTQRSVGIVTISNQGLGFPSFHGEMTPALGPSKGGELEMKFPYKPGILKGPPST